MKDFKERFDKILVDKIDIRQEEINPDAQFIDDLGLDSLDMTELIVEFEQEFNVTIHDDAIEKIITVNDAAQCLKLKI